MFVRILDILLEGTLASYYHANVSLSRPGFDSGRGQLAALASNGRRANPRLSLISRHLNQLLPLPNLNTPFSSERSSAEPDDIEYNPPSPPTLLDPSPPVPSQQRVVKMSSVQVPHDTLLIPGPIEFDDEVLKSMSHYAYVPHSK